MSTPEYGTVWLDFIKLARLRLDSHQPISQTNNHLSRMLRCWEKVVDISGNSVHPS